MAFVERIARIVRRIIGVPDYDAYVAHCRRHHPAEVPLSAQAFATESLTRRYETPGNRCC